MWLADVAHIASRRLESCFRRSEKHRKLLSGPIYANYDSHHAIVKHAHTIAHMGADPASLGHMRRKRGLTGNNGHSPIIRKKSIFKANIMQNSDVLLIFHTYIFG